MSELSQSYDYNVRENGKSRTQIKIIENNEHGTSRLNFELVESCCLMIPSSVW